MIENKILLYTTNNLTSWTSGSEWGILVLAWKMSQLHNKTYYRFIYCVLEIVLGYISCEIKSYFPRNKVAYVIKFGKCRKIHFFIKFEFKHFYEEVLLWSWIRKVIENKMLYTPLTSLTGNRAFGRLKRS